MHAERSAGRRSLLIVFASLTFTGTVIAGFAATRVVRREVRAREKQGVDTGTSVLGPRGVELTASVSDREGWTVGVLYINTRCIACRSAYDIVAAERTRTQNAFPVRARIVSFDSTSMRAAGDAAMMSCAPTEEAAWHVLAALFDQQAAPQRMAEERAAATLDVRSIAEWRRCLQSNDAKGALQRNELAAAMYGVRSVPSFVVRGRRYEHVFTSALIRRLSVPAPPDSAIVIRPQTNH